MKSTVLSIIAIVLFNVSLSSQKIAPYIKVSESNLSINELSTKIINNLEQHSFDILGSYNPSNKESLKVITFTRKDLKNTVVKSSNRGALAAVFKIGLVKDGEKVTVSYTNPDYILRAYLMDDYNNNTDVYTKFSSDLKLSMTPIGSDFTPFGGSIKAKKLKKYHYKVMMPYFNDPVTLNEFASFEEGLQIIEDNLKAHKRNTKMVYKLVYAKEKVAVFGVGLYDVKDGEAKFLPKIGEEHAAALPYEIILQGTKVTMLHGKYRIALHWPELTMGTFMKIMSTPGNIKKTLKEVCM